MKNIFLLLLLFVPLAKAAPFLVSDPWAAEDVQPLQCVYTDPLESSPVIVDVSHDGQGLAYCRFDLATVKRSKHTILVWATNAGGDSEKVPFVFDVSIPNAPVGLRIVK